MTNSPLYPLVFDASFEPRIWGGRRLAGWMSQSLPGEGPIGEAWLLSDRGDHPSRVATGPLRGFTLANLIERDARAMMGSLAARFSRFPLLIKYLDVAGMLSVQVHPSDSQVDLLPLGETGKTEAWFVLAADPGSKLFAGLRPGTTVGDLRSLSSENAAEHLASFTPRAGQTVLIEAGVVHAIGDGLLVLEVQENSDVTFRLYDWDHIDTATGRGRPLQIDEALACVDFNAGPVCPQPEPPSGGDPAEPVELVRCAHFSASRHANLRSFMVGESDMPRVIVCSEGRGMVSYEGEAYPLERGGLMLLPAEVGACLFQPDGLTTVIEIATASS